LTTCEASLPPTITLMREGAVWLGPCKPTSNAATPGLQAVGIGLPMELTVKVVMMLVEWLTRAYGMPEGW